MRLRRRVTYRFAGSRRYKQPRDGIHQRALAGISLADDRHKHLRRGHVLRRILQVNMAPNSVKNLIEMTILDRGNSDRRAEAQPGKLAEDHVAFLTVGLVCNNNGFDILAT